MKTALEGFLARVNKDYGAGTAFMSKAIPSCSRFSSGILELDLAIGGGWPKGTIVLLYGPRASGKTTLALIAGMSADSYCHECGFHAHDCTCKEFSPGLTLFVDREGTVDPLWADSLGFNRDRNPMVRHSTGEATIEIIEQAIKENVFSAIVLDSIEHCRPASEADTKMEDGIMGKHAFMMNRAFRRWKDAISGSKTTLFCINQTREKMTLFGDPLALPGGKGQIFNNSIEVRLKTEKNHDVPGEVNNAYVEISGSIPRNKTYVAKKEFTFSIALADYGPWIKGQVNNAESLLKYAKQLDIIKTGKGGWTVEGFPDLKAFDKEALLKVVIENAEVYAALDKTVRERLI